VVSRLLPYKRVDLAIAGCALAGVPLKIVGAGPAERALRAAAEGTQTEFLGALSDDGLRAVMGDARVVILPGEEDYGLVPLEANASGRPALAYGAGGALETIRPGETGAFFAEPTAESLAAALAAFDARGYDPGRLRAHAELFGPEPFKRRFGELVERIVASGRRSAAGDLAQKL
jgi:glycosyltransferase involved in cell wall biosynthesis